MIQGLLVGKLLVGGLGVVWSTKNSTNTNTNNTNNDNHTTTTTTNNNNNNDNTNNRDRDCIVWSTCPYIIFDTFR